MKKVAILQSDYIPWKGYFDIINSVDEFIIYDDVQYTKRDWRNRNKIVTPNGIMWLTIPVETKGSYYQRINETMVSNNSWVDLHWKSLQMNYARAPYFDIYKDRIKSIYFSLKEEEMLSNINRRFIEGICKLLNIKTNITNSSDYSLVDGKTTRLVELVKSVGGDYYLSGPSAMDYIDSKQFANADIKLEYMDYSNYMPYKQLYGNFCHEVSIIDTLFNTGENAEKYVKCFRSKIS